MSPLSFFSPSLSLLLTQYLSKICYIAHFKLKFVCVCMLSLLLPFPSGAMLVSTKQVAHIKVVCNYTPQGEEEN